MNSAILALLDWNDPGGNERLVIIMAIIALIGAVIGIRRIFRGPDDGDD